MSSTLNNTTRITNERRIAFGPQDQLMNMSRTKYKWATEIYDRMEANTWFPKSIPLVADRETYRSGALNARERNAYDKALAFVSNIKFWREAGYFDAASHEKWLLHTWSLAVEWQFYLLLPVSPDSVAASKAPR